MSIFYVYVYLDPTKPGNYVYGEYSFDYEPFYVGKGKNGRAYAHLEEGRLNKAENRLFSNKIKKIKHMCGHNPHILIYKDHMDELDALNLEKDIVTNIGRRDKKIGPLCNLTDAGDGVSGLIISEQSKKIMSEKKKGINHPNYGKHLSDKTKKKIGDGNRGKKRTEETNRKNRECHIGLVSGNKGKHGHVSTSSIEKMRKAKLGKTWEEICGKEKATKRKERIKEKPKGFYKYSMDIVNKIITLKNDKCGFIEISKQLCIPKSSVYSLYYKYKEKL